MLSNMKPCLNKRYVQKIIVLFELQNVRNTIFPTGVGIIRRYSSLTGYGQPERGKAFALRARLRTSTTSLFSDFLVVLVCVLKHPFVFDSALVEWAVSLWSCSQRPSPG